MKRVHKIYDKIINLENIFSAWKNFQSGKADKIAVQGFRHNLENNLFRLAEDLKNRRYRHGGYEKFIITDPKIRIINKAEARDRIVHTLVARELEEIYQPIFIVNSYACQQGRGIHKALKDLIIMSRRQSENNTKNFWFIKCDVRKFFDNIGHEELLLILQNKIADNDFLRLLAEIIKSYSQAPGRGLPLGNYTSQWLANIYLNELDYFIKQELKIKHYLCYADDFVIMAESRESLMANLAPIQEFLWQKLGLKTHEDKIIVKKYSAGIDFVGYRVLPHYVVVRKRFAKRMLKNLDKTHLAWQAGEQSYRQYYETINSYLGWLEHSAGHKLTNRVIYQ